MLYNNCFTYRFFRNSNENGEAITLEQAAQETSLALDLCFNNKFKEAEIMLKPRLILSI